MDHIHFCREYLVYKKHVGFFKLKNKNEYYPLLYPLLRIGNQTYIIILNSASSILIKIKNIKRLKGSINLSKVNHVSLGYPYLYNSFLFLRFAESVFFNSYKMLNTEDLIKLLKELELPEHSEANDIYRSLKVQKAIKLNRVQPWLNSEGIDLFLECGWEFTHYFNEYGKLKIGGSILIFNIKYPIRFSIESILLSVFASQSSAKRNEHAIKIVKKYAEYTL